MSDLTMQEKIFVDAYLEASSKRETASTAALIAAQKAYPNAAPRSQLAMSHEVLNRRDVQDAIVLGRGCSNVFTKEYLLLQLKQIIESQGNAAARVAAIKIAGEITGHIASQHGSKKAKSRAEELEQNSPLGELAARAAEYQEAAIKS
jgi:hypothetical protein